MTDPREELDRMWIRGDGKGRRMKVSDLRRSGGRRAVKRKDWDRG